MTVSARTRTLLLLLALVALLGWVAICRPGRPPAPLVEAGGSPLPSSGGSGFTVVSSRPPPQPGVEASEPLLGEARRRLGAGAREGRCGPYRLIRAIEEPGMLTTCERIGARLDDVYRERFGVEPLGDPAGTILLFARAEDYRAFAAAEGMASTGYAGYSRPGRGYLALWADPRRSQAFSQTLAHELTHLVHRRALGGNLPRWLSEGLADAVGDTAGPDGIGPLAGLRGVEGQAERMRLALRDQRLGSVARLVSLDPEEFDVGTTSLDYEQSALLVRLLLLDPDLAPGLRAFLTDLAAGEDASAERLRTRLGVDWSELDRRLASWLAG